MRFLAFFIELESMAILFEYTTGGSIITDSPLSIYVLPPTLTDSSPTLE